MFGTGESFTYCTCHRCGSLYINVVPPDLARYYRDNYYSFDFDPEAMLGRPGIRQAVSLVGRSALHGTGRIWSVVKALPNPYTRAMAARYHTVAVSGLPRGRETRVLDIGSGSGLMVYALHLAGVRDVLGIDPFNERDHVFAPGARVLRRELVELDGTWDLIMLHHSLEHVVDPRAELRLVAQRLAPGGRVLVRVPTVSSEVYDRYGLDYYGLDAPRHLTMFSRNGFSDMCAELGFHIRAHEDDAVPQQFWASEQLRRGIPFASPESMMVDRRRRHFSRAQMRAWQKETVALNAQGRGEQSIWVLEVP
jgi:SAM-dependent methyltransferase